MTNDVLISVIVPVYNVREYLEQCIESLLMQTYPEIELILVDDGSTDGSSEIVDYYANLDKRIIAIHQENLGLSEARNSGLNIMRGDYVMFVDGDDYVEKEFCDEALTLAIRHSVDIAAFGFKLFWPDGRQQEKGPHESNLLAKENAIKLLIDSKDIYNFVWNKIFSARLFDSIRFPQGLFFEDVAVIHRLIDKSDTGIYMTERVLYHYRQGRQDSIMAVFSSEKMQNRLTNEFERLHFVQERYPNLKLRQIAWLTNICLLCFIYLPKGDDNIKTVKRFLKDNRREVLLSDTGLRLRRIRVLSFYFALPLFYVINLVLRKFVYRI